MGPGLRNRIILLINNPVGRAGTGKQASPLTGGHRLSSHRYGGHLEEISSLASKHLDPGALAASDGLKYFPGVLEAKCDHEPIPTSGGAEHDEFKVFKWVNTMIGIVTNAIHGTYHAVSRKHLPRYLAEFCYRFNRLFKLGAMVERPAQVALRTPSMSQRLFTLAEVRW
jgi:hypothetical protein